MQYNFQSATTPQNKISFFPRLMAATARATNLSYDMVNGSRRSKRIVQARWIVMYVAFNYFDYSSPAIGRRLGKDHSTVLYGIKMLQAEMEVNPALAARVQSVRDEMASGYVPETRIVTTVDLKQPEPEVKSPPKKHTKREVEACLSMTWEERADYDVRRRTLQLIAKLQAHHPDLKTAGYHVSNR